MPARRKPLGGVPCGNQEIEEVFLLQDFLVRNGKGDSRGSDMYEGFWRDRGVGR